MHGKINIIFGTTASGKTAYSIMLAKRLGECEIVNIDSMQVYREIPIITAQPTLDERLDIPHHLFGCISVFENFSVGKYLELAVPIIRDILARKKTPILVGGTGMYVKALMEGLPNLPESSKDARAKVESILATAGVEGAYHMLRDLDKEMADKLKPRDAHRIARALEVMFTTGRSLLSFQTEAIPFFPRDMFNVMWLNPPRAQIYDKINQRFLQMVEMGVLEEVRAVMNTSNGRKLPPAHGIPEIISYFHGDITLKEAIEHSQQVTRNYAKRQLTWARHNLD